MEVKLKQILHLNLSKMYIGAHAEELLESPKLQIMQQILGVEKDATFVAQS